MKELSWRWDEYIKGSQLVVGKTYIFDDGKVGLYLGKTIYGTHVYYLVGSMIVATDAPNRVPYPDIQISCLKNEMSILLKKPLISSLLLNRKAVPNVRYCLDALFVDETTLVRWITRSQLANKELGNLDLQIMSKGGTSSIYAKIKDLVVGDFYYTGSTSLGSLYIYLGRDEEGLLHWVYISSMNTIAEMLASNNKVTGEFYFEVTKSNKRCKKIEYAVRDKFCYCPREIENLVEAMGRGWRLDLNRLVIRDGRELGWRVR